MNILNSIKQDSFSFFGNSRNPAGFSKKIATILDVKPKAKNLQTVQVTNSSAAANLKLKPSLAFIVTDTGASGIRSENIGVTGMIGDMIDKKNQKSHGKNTGSWNPAYQAVRVGGGFLTAAAANPYVFAMTLGMGSLALATIGAMATTVSSEMQDKSVQSGNRYQKRSANAAMLGMIGNYAGLVVGGAAGLRTGKVAQTAFLGSALGVVAGYTAGEIYGDYKWKSDLGYSYF